MAYGPYAVGRKDGVVVFVPLAAPQDELEVEIYEVQSRYVKAKIIKILRPSPHRKDPACKYFGTCGGCDWQHLEDHYQSEQKRLLVIDFLEKAFRGHDAGFEFPQLKISQSPETFNYRNRVQLKYKAPRLGFYQRGTHDIVDIDSCPLLEPLLNQELPKLRKNLVAQKVSEVERLELFLTTEGKTSHSRAQNLKQAVGFSQVNLKVNDLILQSLKDSFADEAAFHLLEFYAGSGNFSFPLLETFARMRLTAVEWHAPSVQRAQDQLKSQNISPKKARFYSSAVENFLKRHRISPDDIVFLDPPRSGAVDYVMRTIAHSRPRRLLYLSCDPASLSRDLALLLRESKAPWTLVSAQAFDMFPQTHHVETLVELRPRDP